MQPTGESCTALPDNSSEIGSVRGLATGPPTMPRDSRSAASLCVSFPIVALAFLKASDTFR